MDCVWTPVCVLQIKIRREVKNRRYQCSMFSFPLIFSGDPHQFEQKFNYRRPMYPILKYMWGKENYRESIKVTRNKYLILLHIFFIQVNCVFKTENSGMMGYFISKRSSQVYSFCLWLWCGNKVGCRWQYRKMQTWCSYFVVGTHKNLNQLWGALQSLIGQLYK